MTEQEWQGCNDPRRMLQFLRFKRGVRKLRLFTVACYRWEWPQLDDQTRTAVELAEQLANDRERIAARGLRAAKMDADAAAHAAWRAVSDAQSAWGAQAALLRELVGNPFRPVTIDPSWRTSTVQALAQAIYDDRDFDLMPILADALENADCDNAAVLEHCRQLGEHVRGCWLVDLLLGKK